MGSWVAVQILVCMVETALSITTPDTSLDTIPVGYFGGMNCKERAQANIEILAKMRVVVIEKWEGPCWYDCYNNLTQDSPVPCQPSCGAENYQLKTIKQVKKVNPNVTTVFYLDALYDFGMLELHEKFLKAKADMIDVSGKPVTINNNDNGMPNVNIFDFGQQIARDLWITFVKTLKESSVVDGLFPNKSPVLAHWNETGSFWQICDMDVGQNTWNVSCGVISEQTAKDYNIGKQMILEKLYETFAPNGFLFYSNLTKKILLQLNEIDSPLKFAKKLQAGVSDHLYVYVQTGDFIDGGCTDFVKSTCSEYQVAMFLLAVEEGAILGCNGWDEQFSKPLGVPLGPAVQKGNTVERHFKSGTYVTWDLSGKTGKIFWAH